MNKGLSTLLGLACFAPALLAQSTVSWDGGGDGRSWFDRLNWSGDAVPAVTNDVVISVPVTTTIVCLSNVTVRSVQSSGGLAITNANFSVTVGASFVDGPLSIASQRTLSVANSNTTFMVNGAASFPGANLSVSAGGRLEFATLGSHIDAGASFQTRDWLVSGAGSVLRFTSLTNLVGATNGNMRVRVLNGARAEFPALVTCSPQYVQFYCDGVNAYVDLPQLSQPPRGGSEFEARNGAIVSTPLVSDWRDATLTIRGTNSFLPTAQINSLSNVTIVADRFTPNLSNVIEAPLSSFFAENGANITLPAVTTYTNAIPTFQTRELRATGSNSVVNLNALTQLANPGGGALYVRAYSGGAVLLEGVTRIPLSDLRIWAEGSGSQINLPNLVGSPGGNSSFEARNSGTVNIPNLVLATNLQLVLRGTNSTMQVSQFTSLANSSVTVDGVRLDLTNVTDISYASFYVEGGGRLSLPNARNYPGGIPSFQSREFRASGTGSVLDLSSLTNVVGATNGFSQLYVRAYSGGHVLLNSFSQPPPSRFSIWAENTGSLVDLSSLTTSPKGASTFEVRSSGTIQIPLLTQPTQVEIVIRHAPTIPTAQFVSLNNASLTVDGVNLTLTNVTDIALASLYVENGGRLALPNAHTYPAGIPAFENREFRASGANSVLDLSSLTDVVGAINGFSRLYVRAYSGGRVDLTGVSSVVPSVFAFYAEQANSVVDLSNLTVSPGRGSTFEVRGSGSVLIPQIVHAEGIEIAIRGAETLPTTQFTSLSNSTLIVDGTEPDLHAVTNADLSSLYVENGGRLTLPNVTRYGGALPAFENRTWQAYGAGSVLEVTNIQEIAHGNPGFASLNVRSMYGGEVRADSLGRISASSVQFYSERPNSKLLAPALTNWSGSGTIEATISGIIALTTNTLTLTNLTMALRNDGTNTAGRIELWNNSEINGNGILFASVLNGSRVRPGASAGSVTFSEYTQTTNGSLIIEVGGVSATNGYDVLNVFGTALLDGQLDVTRINGYAPAVGSVHRIIQAGALSGEFARFTGLNAGASTEFVPAYDATGAELRALFSAGPTATNATPAGVRTGSLAYFDLQFNEALSSGSVGTNDAMVTGPAGTIPVTSAFVFGGRTARFGFAAQTTPGTYTIIAGPNITDTVGNTMNQDGDAVNGEAFDDRITNSVTLSIADLAVSDVIVPTAALPGQQVQVAYTVRNVGAEPVIGSRVDAVLLSTDAVLGGDTLIGLSGFSESLATGAVVTVTQTVAIPLLGPAGTLRVGVALDYAGAITETTETNNVLLAGTITVPHTLQFQLSSNVVAETSGPIQALVSRNGDVSAALNVTFTTDSTELATPASVTVPAGQTSVAVTLSPMHDTVADGAQTFAVVASTAGFVDGTQTVTVLDSDTPRLTLTTSSNALAEGSSLSITLTRDVVSADPLTVQLVSSSPSQLTLPASIVLPANIASTSFTATAVEDGLVETSHSYSLSASATGHIAAGLTLTIHDNDVPTLTLTSASTSLTEGNTVTMTLTRADFSTTPLQCALVSGAPGRLVVPSSITIAAGQYSASFLASAVDNAGLDGATNVVVSAYPLETLTGDRIVPGTGTSVSITDNDGPALTVRIARDALAENASTTATISRNTPATNEIVVALASSDNVEATVPASIVLSNGQASAIVVITTISDGVSDGSKTVAITATAAGFSDGSDSFLVTDSNLPDLVITSLTVPTNGLTGENFSISFREMNLGTVTATGSWSQVVSLSTDPYPGDDEVLTEFSFAGDVPPGLFIERSTVLRAPTTPGDYWIIVTSDVSNRVTELVEENNSAVAAVPIHVDPSFTAVVQTSVETALAGTAIPMTGTATRTLGGPAQFESVSIHIDVKGTRRVIAALTDSSGHFNATFTPLPGEGGSYTIGAAHPGLATAPVQDAFMLLGIRFNPSSLSTQVVALTSITGIVEVANLADVPLTGLSASVTGADSAVAVTAVIAGSLPASGTVPLELTITSLADAPLTNVFTVQLSSAEGAVATLRVTNRVVQLLPRLAAYPGTITAGMRRGEQTIVPFTIVNSGGAETGPLTVLLPNEPFLHLSSPAIIESIPAGGSNVVTLQLLPATNQPLGTYSGTLAISGTNTSLPVPYSIRSLSDSVGGLLVEVVDEYTYYASGSPRVVGAEVFIRDSISGVLVTNGLSGSNGLFTASSLMEGYYDLEVRATNHSVYRATILTPAGGSTNVTAFISRQAVRYIWTVVPTEIEDRTRITIESVFETFVPIPVITVEPTLLDLAEFTNEVTQVDITIANHGLIAAQNMSINFGTHPDWSFSPLIRDVGTLNAQSSITVPMIVRRTATASAAAKSRAKASGQCTVTAAVNWTLRCGDADNGYGVGIQIINVGGDCPGGGYVRPPGGYGSGTLVHPVGYVTPAPCRPCTNDITQAVLECIISFTPLGCPYDLLKATYECANNAYQNGVNSTTGQGCAKGFILPGIGCVLELFPPAATAWNGGKCAYDIAKAACGDAAGTGASARAKVATSTLALLEEHADRYNAVLEAYTYPLGSDVWFSAPNGDDGSTFTNFMAHYRAAIEESGDGASRVTAAERGVLMALTWPPQITAGDVNALCDRWNRTVDYYDAGIFYSTNVPFGSNPDFVAFDIYRSKLQAAYAAAIVNEAEGFTNISDGLEYALQQVAGGVSAAAPKTSFAKLSRPKAADGICAQVRLRIEQEAVITRDAFKATLEFINGADTPLQNINVNVVVRRADTSDATSLFGIAAPSLLNLNDVSGTGVVLPGTSGSATWTLIPSSDAAPSAATETYFVSGTLSYQQDGVAVTVPLAPAAIDVLPNPALRLRYFHERDVLSDDPFTTNIVEPSQPYSLAVMVQNTGYGTAKNVRIASSQPQIIENEKGLLIDFDIIATEVAGQNLSPSLTVNFGDIASGGISIGRWLLKSTLQGQFIDYSATFEHTDGLGDPRLSLIQSVEIHELIRTVRATNGLNDALPDFLVNDFADDEFVPDTLYFSDASIAPVTPVTTFSTAQAPTSSNLHAQLQAPLPPGWSYLRIPDPANGRFALQRVVRSDGVELPAENFWVTDRTFIAGGRRPLYETNLHLLDFNSTGNYTLIYSLPPAPDTIAPESYVAVLSANSYPNIPITWSGVDDTSGSGIASFDVFVSDNGGAFVLWLDDTTLRGAIYVGAPGHTYGFYTRAKDISGNVELAPASPDTETTVSLANTAPVIAAGGNQTIDEGGIVTVFNSATDADPGTTLFFSLGAGSPGGVSINPANGTVTWPTGEGSGPSTNLLAVIVTDNGVPPLSATGFVTVIVNELNEAPQIATITNRVVNEGSLLQVQASVTDADVPANTLTFSLGGIVPNGAVINPVTGLFTWTPDPTQGPSTNLITVVTTDDGVPPLSAERTFTIVVRNTEGDFKLSIGSTNVLAGSNGVVPIVIASMVDITNVTAVLEAPQDRLTNLVLSPTAPALSSALLLPQGDNRSELRFSTAAGQVLDADQKLAAFNFTAAANTNSAIVPLRWLTLDAWRSTGARLTNGKAFHGRVIIVGDQPVLTLEKPDVLTLYGRPNEFYNIFESATLDTWPVTPRSGSPVGLNSALFYRENVNLTNSGLFFKAERAP